MIKLDKKLLIIRSCNLKYNNGKPCIIKLWGDDEVLYLDKNNNIIRYFDGHNFGRLLKNQRFGRLLTTKDLK